MNKQTITPTVKETEDGAITTHPAFGLVSVNRTHTTGTRLYASDLSHQEVITISFHESEQIERDGYIRHRLGEGRRKSPLLSVSLSPAQWAAMITSFGMGDGVPCTLNSIRTEGYQRLPLIGHTESVRERYDRQIKEAADRQLRRIQEHMDTLAALVAKGKAGKKELADVYSGLASAVNNLPGNLAFTSELIQENMDKIVASGKAELEAAALGVATRLGIQEISRLTALEAAAEGGKPAEPVVIPALNRKPGNGKTVPFHNQDNDE